MVQHNAYETCIFLSTCYHYHLFAIANRFTIMYSISLVKNIFQSNEWSWQWYAYTITVRLLIHVARDCAYLTTPSMINSCLPSSSTPQTTFTVPASGIFAKMVYPPFFDCSYCNRTTQNSKVHFRTERNVYVQMDREEHCRTWRYV